MLRPILAGLGLAALIVISPGHPSLADSRVPYTVEIENATAKVGEPTVVRAIVIPPDGIKLTSVYRHRLIDLTVFEDHGVKFDDEVVIGKVEARRPPGVRGRRHPDRAGTACDQRRDARQLHQRQQVRIQEHSPDRPGDRHRVSPRARF